MEELLPLGGKASIGGRAPAAVYGEATAKGLLDGLDRGAQGGLRIRSPIAVRRGTKRLLQRLHIWALVQEGGGPDQLQRGVGRGAPHAVHFLVDCGLQGVSDRRWLSRRRGGRGFWGP